LVDICTKLRAISIISAAILAADATISRNHYVKMRQEFAMKFGVVQFPGSNCDDDAFYAAGSVIGEPVEFIWHQSEDVAGFDAIILPGGFAYGDYLRTGAIARFSPVMRAVERFAKSGGLVLGICNGFQILLEAGLLPGAMLRNQKLHFLCRQVHVRVENTDTPFTSAAREGQVLKIPIAHMEGNYFCDAATLAELERNRQVVFRYVPAIVGITPGANRPAPGERFTTDDSDANPNGSLAAIAGICNRERNVVGLMPHPERAVELPLGSSDGLVIFRSMVESFSRRAAERVSA
jgi:phosphoribosylformylglycinamidine synthase subunit PurQ / glutaminase